MRQHEERSLGELFGELAREVTTLVRQEVRLAKVELSGKATNVGRSIASLAIGAAVLYAGILALIAALILGLAALGLDLWLSALIVGGGVTAIGAVLVWRGVETLRETDPMPKQTVETVRENIEWAKEQTR